jgi:hypothetical protein
MYCHCIMSFWRKPLVLLKLPKSAAQAERAPERPHCVSCGLLITLATLQGCFGSITWGATVYSLASLPKRATALVQADDGNLYFTTAGDPSAAVPPGDFDGGGIFSLNPQGGTPLQISKFTPLSQSYTYQDHQEVCTGPLHPVFAGYDQHGNIIIGYEPGPPCHDQVTDVQGYFTAGVVPSSLVQGIDGNLFGTTLSGPDLNGNGTIFTVPLAGGPPVPKANAV